MRIDVNVKHDGKPEAEEVADAVMIRLQREVPTLVSDDHGTSYAHEGEVASV